MNLDIIWNISLVCPWDCEFCCTDSVHVTRQKENIIILEESLKKQVIVKKEHPETILQEKFREYGLKPNYLDFALINRQKRGKELTFNEKMTVLKHLDVEGNSPFIDFAGGDPLSCAENLFIIIEAAKKYGQENIAVTSTGHSVSRYPFDLIASNIGCFEFTYDEPKELHSVCRPSGYNFSNIHIAEKMVRQGVSTKCQIPLHEGNIDKQSIFYIVNTLADAGIQEILLMRTFPVGRGQAYVKNRRTLNKKQLIDAIEYYYFLSDLVKGPYIRLQCALKNLFPKENEKNPCDMMQDSFGINYQGILLTSAWATNDIGAPLSEYFVLGDLVKSSFTHISKSKRFMRYKKKLDENFGCCKIFSYIYSKRKNENSIFFNHDPLYIDHIPHNNHDTT